MGLSGLVGAGAQQGLEAALERRLRELMRQQQETQHADQLALQTRQVEGVEAGRKEQLRQFDINELRRVGQEKAAHDQAGMEQRAGSNMAGMLDMGLDPQTLKRETAGVALRSGMGDPMKIIEGLTKIEPPAAKKFTPPQRLADGSIGQFEEGQIPAGTKFYQEPRTPTQPTRDPIADYEAKLKLDATYKQPSGAADPVAEAKDTATEAKRISDALRTHKGLAGAFGVLDSRMPTVWQDTADAEVLRDALTSLLTLENMGKMKGVLSDSDMKVLRQASTTIAAPMSDAAARAELQRISTVMAKAANAAPTAKPLQNGTTVTVGSGLPKTPYELYLERQKPK